MDPTSTPVTTVLSWTLIAITVEFDNAFERSLGALPQRPFFRVSRAMWANYLRGVPDDGIALDDLARVVRIPTPALRGMTGGMERWGYVRVDGAGSGRIGFGSGRGVRATSIVSATPAGRATAAVWRPLAADIEARWTDRFGTRAVDALRAALSDAANDHTLPESLPVIAAPDAFATELRDDDAATPAASDGPPDLLTALSRSLLVRTVAFESERVVSLPLLANFLRVLAAAAVARRDLPRRTGLAKEAVAMACNGLTRAGLACIDPDSKAVTLTGEGLAAFEAGTAGLVASPHDDTLRDALLGVLSQRDALVEGLRPPKAGWRTQKPYVIQTNAVLEDPLAALPHHPMVLHRGGWPDGA